MRCDPGISYAEAAERVKKLELVIPASRALYPYFVGPLSRNRDLMEIVSNLTPETEMCLQASENMHQFVDNEDPDIVTPDTNYSSR